VIALVAACETSSEPELGPCERLRDHVLDTSVSDVVGDQRAQHRAALEAAMRDFVASCTGKLSEPQIACALEARTSPAIRSCMSK
jgi:hypothetical protein